MFTIPAQRKSKNDKVALIDADILRYRVGFASQKGRGEEAVPDPVEHALHSCKVQLNSILEALDTSLYKLYLTGKGNFRETVAVSHPYKGNRNAPKPYHYDNLTDYMVEVWDARVVDGMEADDALGIEQWKNWNQKNKKVETVICSIDKDLKMIPGHHYNFVRDELTYIEEAVADRFFYHQLIAGDATDNIIGIRGYGLIRAEKYLADCETELEMYNKALELYEGNEERLLENARLLWILREDKQVWNPPGQTA